MTIRQITNLFKIALCACLLLFTAVQKGFAQTDSLTIQEVSGELHLNYFLYTAPTNFDTLNIYLGEDANVNGRSYQGTIIYSSTQHCFSLVLNNTAHCFIEETDTVNQKIKSKYEVSFHLPLANYTGERKVKLYLAKKYSAQYFIRERYF